MEICRLWLYYMCLKDRLMNNKLHFSLKMFLVSILLLTSNAVFSMSMAYRHPYRPYSFKVDNQGDLRSSIFKNVAHKNYRMVKSLLTDNRTRSFSYSSPEGFVTIDPYDIARYNKDENMVRLLKRYGCTQEEVADQKASPLVIAALSDDSKHIQTHLDEVIRINANAAFIDDLRASCFEQKPVTLNKNKEILALQNIEKNSTELINIREALAVSVDNNSIASLKVLLNNTLIQKIVVKDNYSKYFNCLLLDCASSHKDAVAFELLLKSPCVNGINWVESASRRPHTRLDSLLENNDTQKIQLIKQYGGLTGEECTIRRKKEQQEITRIIFEAVKHKKDNIVEAILKSCNHRNVNYQLAEFDIKIDLYDVARYNKDEQMINILTKYGCIKKNADQLISPLVIATFYDDADNIEDLAKNATQEDMQAAIDLAIKKGCHKSLELLLSIKC